MAANPSLGAKWWCPSSALARVPGEDLPHATCRKLWSELDIICSSRPRTLADYVTSIGDQDRVLNMLVGDTQRLRVNAELGFATHQPLPVDVMPAYTRQVKGGYTRRLAEPSAG